MRPADAGAITGEKAVADYFEAAVTAYGQEDGKPQRMANWITDELFRLLYADGEGQDLRQIADTRVQPQQLAALVQMVDAREINANTGKKVLESMYKSGDDPQAVVEREGLAMVSNTDVIDAAVQEAFDNNPDELARYRGGEKKLFGFFMGQMMRATKGKADPQASPPAPARNARQLVGATLVVALSMRLATYAQSYQAEPWGIRRYLAVRKGLSTLIRFRGRP